MHGALKSSLRFGGYTRARFVSKILTINAWQILRLGVSRESVIVPGSRDVRGTLDDPGSANACVVACPPHPRHGGSRSDRRLVAVSEALDERGIACMRFDYGAWDGGDGERRDAENAVRWARDRYPQVALFGYSFGGAIALLAASAVDVVAVSTLAPAASLAPDLDAVAALGSIDVPVQVVYGARDTTVDWESVVECAREHGHATTEVSADHFFVNRYDDVARSVADFFETHL